MACELLLPFARDDDNVDWCSGGLFMTIYDVGGTYTCRGVAWGTTPCIFASPCVPLRYFLLNKHAFLYPQDFYFIFLFFLFPPPLPPSTHTHTYPITRRDSLTFPRLEFCASRSLPIYTLFYSSFNSRDTRGKSAVLTSLLSHLVRGRFLWCKG